MKKYFGTDGIRGRVGQSLMNAEFTLKLGWALGEIFRAKKPSKVIIGKDTRISGSMIESALQAGLSAAGVDSYLLGVIPTPAVAYLTHSLRADAGVVISASHNAYPDNGIKFFDSNGMKLSDDLEKAIEDNLEKPMQTRCSEELGKIYTLADTDGRYIEFCKSIFPSQLSLHNLTLVVDCANGATYKVAPTLFRELDAKVLCLHSEPDGFNINQECGATDLRSLQTAVTDHHADLGIAFDGDGDRVMMVDHNGERVDGDEILCILAKDELENLGKQMGIVGTVMSNLGLEQALYAMGVAFERTTVGDRYVLEELLSRGWKLGGENSGHIVNLNYTTTGDGIITALQVLRIMQTTANSLYDLKKIMTKRPQILINVPADGMKELHTYPAIHQAVAKLSTRLSNRGRILLRLSGTEPLIRVMVEGNDEAEVRQAAEELAQVVRVQLLK